MGGGIIVIQYFTERSPFPPRDLHRKQEPCRLETRAIDENVELSMRSIFEDGAALADTIDRCSDNLDVVALQRLDPCTVVSHDPFRSQRRRRQYSRPKV